MGAPLAPSVMRLNAALTAGAAGSVLAAIPVMVLYTLANIQSELSRAALAAGLR